MKKRFLPIPILLTVICIVCVVLFNACSNKKIGSGNGNGNGKDWVHWTVVFKPGASEEQISSALGRIDSYLLSHIYHDDPEHKKIAILNISHNITFGTPNTGTIVAVTAEAAAIGGGKIRVNPPKPPKDELLPNIGGIDFIK